MRDLDAQRKVLHVAYTIGFGVEDHTFDEGTNGHCSHSPRRIRLEVRLEPAHRVKTLAHALLHAEPGDRALKELGSFDWKNHIPPVQVHGVVGAAGS